MEYLNLFFIALIELSNAMAPYILFGLLFAGILHEFVPDTVVTKHLGKDNMFEICRVEKEIGGKILSIETGKLARQAHGAVVVQYGETMVLVTATTAPPRGDIDSFPLSVDYREKLSAAGKFPGGFMKREGRPSTKEILTARLIDRPVRPLFPDGYFSRGMELTHLVSTYMFCPNTAFILSIISSEI